MGTQSGSNGWGARVLSLWIIWKKKASRSTWSANGWGARVCSLWTKPRWPLEKRCFSSGSRERVCVRETRRDGGGREQRERKRFVCELLARIARERTVNIEGVVVKRREEGEENYSEFFLKKNLVEDHGGCEVFWSSSGLLAKQQVCVQVGRRQRFQSRRRCHSFVCQ